MFRPVLLFVFVLTAALVHAAPMKYRLSDGSENWPEDKRKAIVEAMDGALAIYNKLGNFPKDVTAEYNPGVPTADGNYNGHIRFGGQIGVRVALHELGHVLGAGTHPDWGSFVKDGVWTGKHATEQLRKFDGPNAVLHADRMHFWPYGLNFDTEDSPENRRRHVLMVAALRWDLGIGGPPAPAATPSLFDKARAAAKPRSTPVSPLFGGYLMGYCGAASGICLAVSEDGLNWMPLNGNRPVLAAENGKPLRAPFFFRRNDGKFVVLASDEDGQAPRLWDTDDFLSFRNARRMDAGGKAASFADVGVFWDPIRKTHGVLGSSGTQGVVVSYSEDFGTFRPPEPFYDASAPVAGFSLLREPVEGQYFLFFSDAKTAKLSLARAKSLAPHAFEVAPSAPVAGDEAVRAPLAFRLVGQNRWLLWGDSADGLAAWSTDNPVTGEWKPVGREDFTVPMHATQATVLPLTRVEMTRLLAKWSRPTWNRLKSLGRPELFVRREEGRVRLGPANVSAAGDSALWRVVPGLAGGRGVSFESFTEPGMFLKEDNGVLVVARRADTPEFRAAATFTWEPGKADPKRASFQSTNRAGQYLCVDGETLSIKAVSSEEEKKDATFSLVF